MSTSTSTDLITNLSNLLPTGTFLTFQSLAPLFTNNGVCHKTEKIVTGILVSLFVVGLFGLSFVDSVITPDGKTIYGVVTKWGLYNKQFAHLKLDGDLFKGDTFYTGGGTYFRNYTANFTDFANGVLNVIAFGALSCLTPPVSTCFYPGLSPTVVKTGPILAAIVVGALFGAFPSARHGLGNSQTKTPGFKLVKESTITDATSTSANTTGSKSESQPLPDNIAGAVLALTDYVSTKV